MVSMISETIYISGPYKDLFLPENETAVELENRDVIDAAFGDSHALHDGALSRQG